MRRVRNGAARFCGDAFDKAFEVRPRTGGRMVLLRSLREPARVSGWDWLTGTGAHAGQSASVASPP